MRYSNEQLFRSQFEFLRRQFLQDGELPFVDVLARETVQQALDTIEVAWNERSTLLRDPLDLPRSSHQHSRFRVRAVARFVAHRVSRGQRACSSHTGAYCQMRKRLPEQFFAHIARGVGAALDGKAESDWRWKNRKVFMFDGTTISMPDTPSNQQAYPQSNKQTPGVGFPLARVGAIFSLSCGAILDLAVAGYSGKGQGEVTLFRQLWDLFRPGDVVLTDALMCNWRNLCSLQQRRIDTVTRLNKALRKADFRRGKRLGKNDHLVRWGKPSMRDIDRETYRSFPDFITVRECRFYVDQPGFRSNEVIIVTTILDPRDASVAELAELYGMRWNNETDFSSLKVTLQMDVLRCKTPELVRKEIWTHVLAYNLIRTIMAQSCCREACCPERSALKQRYKPWKLFSRSSHHRAVAVLPIG